MGRRSAASLTSVVLGSLDLMRSRAFSVLIGAISFAMVCALSFAFTQRKADVVQTQFSSALGVDRDTLDVMLDRDLSALSSLSFHEFSARVQEARREIPFGTTPTDAANVGMAYALRMAPYLFLEALVNLLCVILAGLFFLLLFTRAAASPSEAASLLPLLFFRTILVPFFCILHPFFLMSVFGPVLGVAILSSGERSVHESVKEARKRVSGNAFKVLFLGVSLLIVAFLFLWPLLILSSPIGLFSLKVWYFLILTLFMVLTAFVTGGFAMMTALLA